MSITGLARDSQPSDKDKFPRLPSAGLIGRSRPIWTAPADRVHRWARVAHGRTRMIVFPLRRSVGFKAATASSRVETLPMFVRSRPSRTRWTISLSWASTIGLDNEVDR